MRGNGERIGPQNLPTSSIAGGIWNLLNQQRAQQRGAWPSATPAVTTDPYFMYVPLLLNTTSTNAQQNNTFLDSSSNTFTITRNGTPTQGAFTPYQPSGYWSGYFDGTSGQYLNTVANAAFSFGTGDFTIEGWVFPTTTSGTAPIVEIRTSATNSTGLAFLRTPGALTLNVYTNSVFAGASTNSLILNAWNHVALVRSGNTWSYWINGVASGSFTNTSSQTDGATTGPKIGGSTTTGEIWIGYLSNIRIVKGTAVYTGAFTPSTTPLTAITNTSLLTLQSNRFIDNGTANSGSGFPITVNGTPKVQAFQPFAPAASYSAATYGGSGYFNGSTDYLSNATSGLITSAATYTIEAWIYISSYPGSGLGSGIIGTADQSSSPVGFNIQIQSAGKLQWGEAWFTSIVTSASSVPLNQWTHVAFVKSSSSASGAKIYINGVLDVTGTLPNSTYATSSFVVGRTYTATNGSYWNGYISNLRMVNGTAIAPPAGGPTSPVTAVSGTSLLTNFTNAGIYDAAWQNNALTVGDAQASTTQYKWSPTSMKFDGTGDGLKGTVTTNVTPVSGDFTWEGWVYFNTLASAQCLIGIGNSQDRTILYFDNSTGLTYVVARSAANQILASQGSTSGWATGTWYYFAVTRSGNVYTVYRNGTSIATVTSAYTQSDLGLPMTVGYSDWSTSNLYFNGYIQDLRITKGVARTITTPTAAFPTR
jgi:hypothetical protein